MKVLHLISSGGMYGAEAVILSLMAELNATCEHRCALGVFHNPAGPKPTLYDVALERGFPPDLVHLVTCRGQFDRTVPAQFRALADQSGADLIHAHGYKADIFAALAWRADRPALVSTCHTWYDNDLAVRLYGAADRFVLRRFDQVVAVSDEVRARLLAAHVAPSRIRLIRNGVNMQTFAAAKIQRQTTRTTNEPLRIGLVGRLAQEKGIDVLIRAAAIVIRQSPNVVFRVAGDGPDRASLEDLIRQTGIQDRVHLLGRQPDMPGFYATTDILVSSSRQEGLPVALLEGMASALPVVATRVGAVPEVIVDGESGLLVPPDQPEALASAILRLLNDPDLRLQFAAAAQNRIAREFSSARMAADYLDCYRAALASRGVPHRKSLSCA